MTRAAPPHASEFLARELRITLALLSRVRDEAEGLMDAITEGILQLGPGGIVVRANRAARALLSLPADPEGLPLHSLVPDEVVRACLDPAAKGGGPESLPRQIEHEGRRLIVRTRSLPARLGVGTVVVLLDVSALQRFEGLRRDFVASASHELKTPLTSIRGYAELLLDRDPPPELRRSFLEKIARNATRLEALVDDLLDLSRLDTGGWRPQPEPVDVRDAALEAWAQFEEGAERKGVRFSIQCRGRRVLADRTGLVRVLANLFANALRHTPPGGQISVHAPEAEAVSPSSPPSVTIEVRDTGTGIPAEALPRIFERFYRVDAARARADGGTGLGLAIVKHLVERMDGDVGATSTLGKGTTIRVRLPAAEL